VGALGQTTTLRAQIPSSCQHDALNGGASYLPVPLNVSDALEDAGIRQISYTTYFIIKPHLPLVPTEMNTTNAILFLVLARLFPYFFGLVRVRCET